MKQTSHNLRKAAVLVASLDVHTAASLLEQMSPSQAELVRETIDNLGPLDPFEQREVIEEFFRVGPMVPAKQPSGIELDSRLAQQLSLPESHARPATRHVEERGGDYRGAEYRTHSRAESRPETRTKSRGGAPPFRFLDEAPVARLAPFLEREHPQTIAVVISHLPPTSAAEVLASLAPNLQAEVARRLVDLDETDPEILKDIEAGLESWLAEEVRHDRRRIAGVAALNSILEAAPAGTQSGIFRNLVEHDRQLAVRLTPPRRPSVRAAPVTRQQPVYTFADLVDLDDAAIATVLHKSEAEVVVLALAGASPELVERVMRQLPLAEARTLRYALDNLGPTRLSDVEQSQQRLADLARNLARDGQLKPGPRKRLSIAV